MKTTKAILSGMLLWVLIFFEVSILMFGFKLEGIKYYLIHFILAFVLVTICALLYFRKTKANWKQGFILGIIFIITGLILDAAITVPLFVKNYSFFLDIYLWLGYLEGVIITTVIGWIEK